MEVAFAAHPRYRQVEVARPSAWQRLKNVLADLIADRRTTSRQYPDGTKVHFHLIRQRSNGHLVPIFISAKKDGRKVPLPEWIKRDIREAASEDGEALWDEAGFPG